MEPQDNIMDVLVVGGGINGAGIALDAVRRGLSVGLYEQHDFGFGASTATSKLAHGGLRYLEQYQFNLVKESLNERNFLLDQAPHLVKPLQFYVPLYSTSKWKLWKLRLGLSFYDWIQDQKVMPRHRVLNKHEVSHDIPWLNLNDFVGAVSYYDAQMEDHRILIELLMMANQEGANVHNYSKILKVEENRWGYACDVQASNGVIRTVNAKSVVAATGAWNNQFSTHPLVSPTKGVHIVLPDMDLPVALLLMHPKDDRVFFVMPWKGQTLVGTTDQYDEYDYDSPSIAEEEIQYLLDAINSYSINRAWTISDVSSVFCGFRPIVNTTEISPSAKSRGEKFDWVKPNFLAVSGGKYTTYRNIAEQCMNMIQKEVFKDRILLKPNTKKIPFIGKMNQKEWPSDAQIENIAQRYHVHRESLMHLIDLYGNNYKEVLNMITNNQKLSVRFDIEYPMILAELQYAIAHEWVVHLSDFLLRRTYYGYLHIQNESFLKSTAHAFRALTDTSISENEMVSSIKEGFQHSCLK